MCYTGDQILVALQSIPLRFDQLIDLRCHLIDPAGYLSYLILSFYDDLFVTFSIGNIDDSIRNICHVFDDPFNKQQKVNDKKTDRCNNGDKHKTNQRIAAQMPRQPTRAHPQIIPMPAEPYPSPRWWRNRHFVVLLLA